MSDVEEIQGLLDRLSAVQTAGESQNVKEPKEKLRTSVLEASKAFSGSWIGYHSRVYFDRMRPPPPGYHFNIEWGLQHPLGRPVSTGWTEFSEEQIEELIEERAGSPNLSAAQDAATLAKQTFELVKEESLAILRANLTLKPDSTIEIVLNNIENVKIITAHEYVLYKRPSGTLSTRDSIAASQKLQVPPHIKVDARIFELDAPFTACIELAKALRPGMLHLKRISQPIGDKVVTNSDASKSRIFIGHGRSPVWKDLKDFLQDRLKLSWDEFNRETPAGKTTIQRLSEMLASSSLAFLVMTAEDEQSDGKLIARQNVIHEVGLFQGRLGFSKAIVVLEDGCEEFSNIQGLGQIRFAKNHISSAFEEIRKVLEREGVLPVYEDKVQASGKRKLRTL
jgi:predicted nucleotide-binding protein